jgi:sugar transferase (PEP-CTERM/EpsH1 system associated)
MADILFLAHRAPWPPDRGDRIRSWQVFKALTRLGNVHVAALCDTEHDARVARERMEPLCASLRLEVRRRGRVAAMLHALAQGVPASVAMFRNAALGRHIGGMINHGPITHIVGFSSQMGQYIPTRDRFPGPVVMDFVDVDSAKFEAYAADDTRQPMHWVHSREGRLLAAYEAALARRVDASLFVSEAESMLFRVRSGLSAENVHAISNGIDTDYFDPAADFAPLADARVGPGPLAVMTGQMDYRPNIDAAAWFVRDVLPRWRTAVPGAGFAIVGRAPTAEVTALAETPGVIVTGGVPDVRPWLARADVAVAPLLLARGIQNKVLEAMAMALPVVASPAAAEGIDADDGTHVSVADGADQMAAALAALSRNRAGADAMGAAARARMIALYGWDARMAPLAHHL